MSDLSDKSKSKLTCWTVIQSAAKGEAAAREDFARRYTPAVRAYLGARWRSPGREAEIDDATQEVFLECFRRDGILDRVERHRQGGFRAFLYGLVRNVARRMEARRGGGAANSPSDLEADLRDVEADETRLSEAFDKSWAKAIIKEAATHHAARARASGEPALRRVELLRLRFNDDLPIRDIAKLWNVDAEDLHVQYRYARQEFKEALREVIEFHHPDSPREVEREIAEILGSGS